MSVKMYKNELIILVSVIFMLGAFLYKQHSISEHKYIAVSSKNALNELQEIVSLKKIWGDKRIGKKCRALQKLVPPSKIKWQQSATKLTASFSSLSPLELNRLLNKILNIAAEIQKLEIRQSGLLYTLELKCKW